jgi:O-acetyl-ADP-ribose deacetylase (regulator of RNase III)
MSRIIYVVNGDITNPRPGHGCAYVVNTVNCVGVMGKGVALAFKTKYPWIMPQYERLCRQHKLLPGEVYSDAASESRPDSPYILNAATKDHWRDTSQMSWIVDILCGLSRGIEQRHITEIAMPALGCGNGKLDWDEVGPLIAEFFEGIDLRIMVYISEGMHQYHIAETKPQHFSAHPF